MSVRTLCVRGFLKGLMDSFQSTDSLIAELIDAELELRNEEIDCVTDSVDEIDELVNDNSEFSA
jgi:hypothetical protein